MPPENELLILSARLTLTPEESAALTRILEAPLNWSEVKEQSGRLGVQPLLYKHLQQKPYAQQVPDSVLKDFQEAYRFQAMRSLRIYAQIIQLLEAMNRASIPVVLLKGALLAKWVYVDTALRPMSDIDIFCREADADSVKKVLFGLGYYQQAVYNSPLHERVFTLKRHMPPFLRERAVPVEVHTNYSKSGPKGMPDMAKTWEKAVPLTLFGAPCFRLSNEDLLIHLFAHLAKHLETSGTALYWFCDLYELTKLIGSETDWNSFHGKATALAIQNQIGRVYRFMEAGWKMEQGEFLRYSDLAEKLADNKIAFQHRLFCKGFGRKKELFDYIHNLQSLRQAGEMGSRLYFLGRYLIPTRENLVSRYNIPNKSALPFYYVIHPFVLLKRAAASLIYNVFIARRS